MSRATSFPSVRRRAGSQWSSGVQRLVPQHDQRRRYLGTTVRLSNLGSGAPYKTSSGFAFTYGDYFSMAVQAGKSYVIWGEGPNYVGPGGTWSTIGS